jgi:transposase
MALKVAAASEGDREQVAALAQEVQQATGNSVELAYVDQGYTGEHAALAAEEHGVRLSVVKHPMAKRGFVMLPKRWVVERSFAWAAHFRRLTRADSREAAREALTGVCIGQPLSGERLLNRSVDAFQSAEDNTVRCAKRVPTGSAPSVDPGMYIRLLFGNREVSLSLHASRACGRTAKAGGRRL